MTDVVIRRLFGDRTALFLRFVLATKNTFLLLPNVSTPWKQ